MEVGFIEPFRRFKEDDDWRKTCSTYSSITWDRNNRVGKRTGCIGNGSLRKVTQSNGTLHGGVLSDLAMGYAFYSTLAGDELFTTVEIKLNFLKPIWEGKLRAESKLIKKGNSTGLVECYVYDKKGSLVAHSTSTCMILKGNADGKRVKS
ncbi:PaaI family thioesterase [Peribacillus asahii]|uniref:PaaI family thioesterase n=1 Tax=Peribacillus asahii TaxID=228899 RepID=UPI0038241D5D